MFGKCFYFPCQDIHKITVTSKSRPTCDYVSTILNVDNSVFPYYSQDLTDVGISSAVFTVWFFCLPKFFLHTLFWNALFQWDLTLCLRDSWQNINTQSQSLQRIFQEKTVKNFYHTYKIRRPETQLERD